MAAGDDAVQSLAAATPGKRQRGGARKVVSTMDFSETGSGLRAAVAVFGGAAANRRSALTDTLEAEALPAADTVMNGGGASEQPFGKREPLPPEIIFPDTANAVVLESVRDDKQPPRAAPGASPAR